MYNVKIIKDSIAPNGKRLTTWELTYPRMVHAELMTHRLFSRNSASSRAIPNEKLRALVAQDPALPLWWGKNQAGMQAREELQDPTLSAVKLAWLKARDQMLEASEALATMGLHKQLCNRLIEPWMFITVILSATEFDNWFHLRDHKDAQPEIAWVAKEMQRQYIGGSPASLKASEWHLPFINEEDDQEAFDRVRPNAPGAVELMEKKQALLKKVSVGRCARVSYLTHDGRRDLAEDVKLHDRLCAGPSTGDPGHWSPFEHVAMALETQERSGNFIGWKQYRKEFAMEHYQKRKE